MLQSIVETSASLLGLLQASIQSMEHAYVHSLEPMMMLLLLLQIVRRADIQR
jgi:hypothetical protein